MNKWKVYRISQLGTVNRGKSKHRPRNDKILYGGKYPFIQTGDVKEANFYINKHTETYNDVGLAQSKLWDKETLCITIAANIGDTAILSYPACFPDSIVGFRPYEGISDVRFLKYYFDIYKRHMESISMGATQNNLSIKKLESLKFILPDLETQEKIADILSTYDELIENNSRRIEILEKTAEEIYNEWFVRMRFPGHGNTKFIKGIPEGWEVKKIGDLFKIKSGFAFKSKWWQDSGVPVIKIKDIQNNTLDLDDFSFVSKENAEKSRGFYVQAGDLLIAMTGATIGKIALVPYHDLMTVNQRVGKFFLGDKPQEKVAFMFCLFLQKHIQELIVAISSSNAAQPNISPFDIEKIKILYNESVVNEFNSKMKPCIILLLKLQKQNQNLIKQRDLLLPRLMNGTIEVK